MFIASITTGDGIFLKCLEHCEDNYNNVIFINLCSYCSVFCIMAFLLEGDTGMNAKREDSLVVKMLDCN